MKEPRKLLFSVTKKDLEITWFSGKGAGGQHRNKHQNCCRIKHPDSRVIVTGQEERSRKQNLKNAFNRLVAHPKFKTWLKIRASEEEGEQIIMEKEIERAVNEAMKPENIKVECFEAMKTITEWDQEVYVKASNNESPRDVLQAIRIEALDAAIEAIKKVFRETMASAFEIRLERYSIKAIENLKEKK